MVQETSCESSILEPAAQLRKTKIRQKMCFILVLT